MNRVHFGVKEYFCFYFGEKSVLLLLFWREKSTFAFILARKEYFYFSHKILTEKNKCVVYLIN